MTLAAPLPLDGSQAWAPLFASVAQRYGGAGRMVRGFIAGKLRRDPVHRMLLAMARRHGGFGSVTDIGCGRGQLGLALLLSGCATRVVGLDRNALHLAQAEAAAREILPVLDFHAVRQDLADDEAVPAADTVLLIDILYQLDPATQDRLLWRAAEAARRLLLIRTFDPGRGLRSRLTKFFEVTTQPFSPHSGAHVAPRDPTAFARELEARGFDVSIEPCWEGTPFANVLLVARK